MIAIRVNLFEGDDKTKVLTFMATDMVDGLVKVHEWLTNKNRIDLYNNVTQIQMIEIGELED